MSSRCVCCIHCPHGMDGQHSSPHIPQRSLHSWAAAFCRCWSVPPADRSTAQSGGFPLPDSLCAAAPQSHIYSQTAPCGSLTGIQASPVPACPVCLFQKAQSLFSCWCAPPRGHTRRNWQCLFKSHAAFSLKVSLKSTHILVKILCSSSIKLDLLC